MVLKTRMKIIVGNNGVTNRIRTQGNMWEANNIHSTTKNKINLLFVLGWICSSLAGVKIFSKLIGLLGGAFSS